MFATLKAKNFRKLTDHTFSFQPGLNAIRGLNEHGKSTLFEALGYALFGSDALRESLDDVVTWGEKVSTLKVELTWQVNEQVISITRSKAGAELHVDGKLTVTGQKEVTRFVEERLTDAKLASKLMLANQASLRGALSEGPTAAARLIEQLSNFELIDEIIELVTTYLPTGSSAALDQQLADLSSRLEAEKPAALDKAELETAVKAADAKASEHRKEANALGEQLAPAKAAATEARANAQALATAEALLEQTKESLASHRQRLQSLNLEPAVTPVRLEELKLFAEQQSRLEESESAWAALQQLPRPEVDWEGDYASFKAAWEADQRDLDACKTEVARLQVERATAVAKFIREQSCAFCGKDLQDVPEVVRRNAEATEEVARIDRLLATAQKTAQACKEQLPVYEAIDKAARKHTEAAARYSQYIRLEDTRVPAVPMWVGPDRSSGPVHDYRAELRAAEAEMARVAREQGQAASLVESIREGEQKLVSLQAECLRLSPLVQGNKAISHEQDLLNALRYQQDQERQARSELERCQQALIYAEQQHAAKVAAYARLEADRDKVLANLSELAANNVLLKKLRTARPKVADKLWTIVLSTVSFYFSQIRGTQSVVTKEDNGFKVDGKPVTGLSGSTLDALGLAIRIALTKTFMPNTDFLVLDEPGAACDEEREANMLGLVSACGFDQVLLVTHSQLADVFADSVIQL